MGVYAMIAVVSVVGGLFLVVVIAAALYKDVCKMRVKEQTGGEEVQKVLESFDALTQKLEKIERRMSNIESIVIEHERVDSFDNQLRDPGIGSAGAKK